MTPPKVVLWLHLVSPVPSAWWDLGAEKAKSDARSELALHAGSLQGALQGWGHPHPSVPWEMKLLQRIPCAAMKELLFVSLFFLKTSQWNTDSVISWKWKGGELLEGWRERRTHETVFRRMAKGTSSVFSILLFWGNTRQLFPASTLSSVSIFTPLLIVCSFSKTFTNAYC